MTDQLAIPPRSDFEQRYGEARRLRTRALGTPFWVRIGPNGFVVTTNSGADRPIAYEVVARCWSHIRGDEPLSRWKALSENNSSYLAAIYDDMTESRRSESLSSDSVPDPSPSVPRNPLSEVGYELDPHALAIGLRDQTILDLKEELRRLHARSVALAPTTNRVEADAQAAESLRVALEEATKAKGEVSRLEGDLRAMAIRRQVAEDKAARADKRTADCEARIASADARVKAAERNVADAADDRRKRPLAPTPVVMRLDIGALRFEKSSNLPDEVTLPLARAAKKVFTDPESAIVECRRALEAVAKLLYLQAFGRPTPDRGTAAVLADLRGHASVPDADWHQAKNLYARASAVVHDGGASAQLALWIWLGTQQLAELTEPVGSP